jgi:hypothetical protein
VGFDNRCSSRRRKEGELGKDRFKIRMQFKAERVLYFRSQFEVHILPPFPNEFGPFLQV